MLAKALGNIISYTRQLSLGYAGIPFHVISTSHNPPKSAHAFLYTISDSFPIYAQIIILRGTALSQQQD